MNEDILNRQEYVDNLIEIVECVSQKKSGCCFAIDGQWGVGKTYVLDMFEKQISEIQSEETHNDKYFVFNYNCWKYDYYEEPSIAIVSAMLDKIEEEERLFGEKTEAFLESAWGKAKEKIAEIAGEFSKNKIGINLVELVKNINNEAEKDKEKKYDFDKMFSFKKTLTSTREKITELAKEKSIIFIVDELDRCLPSYAIKVLERLHHLFEGIDNVIIIISIDRAQLEHSIQQIYGAGVDVDKYLKKFINFSLFLDKGNLNTSFKAKYKEYFNNFYEISEDEQGLFYELFTTIFEGINVRTQEKLIFRAKLIHENISNEEIVNPALLCFELLWVVFSYKNCSNELRWIPEINKATYFGLKEKIGNKNEDLLKNYEKSVGSNGSSTTFITKGSKSYRKINDRLIDNTFWIFASIYHEINNNTCFEYFCENSDRLSKEVEIAKKFKTLAQILK